MEECRQDRAGGRWEGEDGQEVAGLAGALGSLALIRAPRFAPTGEIRAPRPAPPCKISTPRLPEQASPGSRSLGHPPDFFCLGLTRGLWFFLPEFSQKIAFWSFPWKTSKGKCGFLTRNGNWPSGFLTRDGNLPPLVTSMVFNSLKCLQYQGRQTASQ